MKKNVSILFLYAQNVKLKDERKITQTKTALNILKAKYKLFEYNINYYLIFIILILLDYMFYLKLFYFIIFKHYNMSKNNF